MISGFSAGPEGVYRPVRSELRQRPAVWCKAADTFLASDDTEHFQCDTATHCRTSAVRVVRWVVLVFQQIVSRQPPQRTIDM